VILVATVVLLVAIPFLLWPLLQPPELPLAAEATGPDREKLARQVEEVELDLASGRLDRREAERRLLELRSPTG
jgi:cytochrome c-type biogenesis protein CcmI